MKKILVICMTVLLILAGITFSASAAGQATISFAAGAEGENPRVEVRLSGDSGPEMLQFCIRYDADALRLDSVTPGNAFNGTGAPTVSNPEVGRIYLAWDALKPLSDGTLLVLRFTTVNKKVNETTLFIDESEDIVAMTGDFQEIDLNLPEGKVPLQQKNDDMQSNLPDDGKTTNEMTDGPETNMEISSGEMNLTSGESAQLTAGNGEEVLWTSSNEKIATVENGKITAVSPGTALIIAESDDGLRHAVCKVTVPGSATAEDAVNTDKESTDANAPKTALDPVVFIIAGVLICAAIIVVILLIIRNRKNGEPDYEEME